MKTEEKLWIEFKKEFPKSKPETFKALSITFPSRYWEVIEIIYRETLRLKERGK